MFSNPAKSITQRSTPAQFHRRGGAQIQRIEQENRIDLHELGRARPSNLAAWANRELWAPCFQVKVVGTTGSGDATIAGLLSALLRDLSPEQAITAAVAVGACNVEAADALAGIRTWEETWHRMHGRWARHELKLDVPGWQFNEQYHLWEGSAGT